MSARYDLWSDFLNKKIDSLAVELANSDQA